MDPIISNESANYKEPKLIYNNKNKNRIIK